jgi:dihydroorotate dehydrogenase (NAD+) catalytic subunit
MREMSQTASQKHNEESGQSRQGTTSVNLALTSGGLAFRNPVLTASGTFGYGKEFEPLTDLSSIGGLVTKGISPQPRFGNSTPRICETASGMLNSIGLENVGVEGFRNDKLPYLRSCGTRVIVNFFGVTFDEYVACGESLSAMQGVDALEMNVSCPNIKAGGIEFGTDPRVLADLVRACRPVVRKPLWIKLTPNTSDIVALAKACADGGADGLSIINTITGMAIDVRTRRPKIATTFGGLSGPAIKPIALRMVHQVHRAGVPLPISGIGGIQDATDVLEFLLAGASTVQVGTQNFVDPDSAGRLVRELAAAVHALGVTDMRELIGALKPA